MATVPKRRFKTRLATTRDAGIAAILSGQYECADKHDAESIREALKRQFTPADSPDPAALCLWIKGYALSEQDKLEGYQGHFALIRIAKKGRAYTLTAAQHWQPLTRHPGRKRPSYPHPDARHPLLRTVAEGKTYTRMEDALAVLTALHAQFPRTSIPGPAKLHIQIYTKQPKAEGPEKPTPIRKHLLEVITTQEGLFTLRLTEKPQKKAKKKLPTKPINAPEPAAPTGFFSARESLKRERKRK